MKKIFILEDEPGMAKLISDFMARKGYESVIAYDLEEAEKKIDDDFEFVILDIMLKKGTSFPFLEKIKKERPSLPVYMFSGYDDKDFMDEAKRLGADGFIPKTMGLEYFVDFFLSKKKPSEDDKD